MKRTLSTVYAIMLYSLMDLNGYIQYEMYTFNAQVEEIISRLLCRHLTNVCIMISFKFILFQMKFPEVVAV